MSQTVGAPVVLELASLPREQVGPFLLLGVDKIADMATVEEHWAERLKLSRRQLIKVPLEDINWAREVLGDKEKRIRADAASLNLDTVEGVLRELSEHFGAEASAARCGLVDEEKDLREYVLPAQLPDLEEVKASIVIPDVPEELPAARGILQEFASEPLDPWNLPL